MSSDFYDVLRVDRAATLDEIKLAFKKRALQVHPDKGGSKEAFHLVYEALETLADPQARRKYDLEVGREPPVVHGQPKASKGKHGHPGGKTRATKATRSRPQRNVAEPAEARSWKAKQQHLLVKIHGLLKQLPRDERNRIFTQHFSQKQRLILEQWMVEKSQPSQSGEENRLVQTKGGESKAATQPATAPTDETRDLEGVTDTRSRSLALVMQAGLRLPNLTRGTVMTVEPTAKAQKIKSNGKKRNSQGCVFPSSRSRYRASICFDTLQLTSRNADLQTALDHLVVLTLVKQRMQDATANPAKTFEERLQESLSLCAKEHGTNLADIKLRFSVCQPCAFFFGRSILRTPGVRSIEQLGKMLRSLEPFRKYSKKSKKNLLWQFSPAHLREAWERLQLAVAYACEVAGVNSAKYMQRLRDAYNANAGFRSRRLQNWEREHMAMQDRNKHRPRKLRVCEERRVPIVQSASRKLSSLTRLVARWERMLTREADAVSKQRHKLFKQQRAQRKKDAEERKRLELFRKKQLQGEQRLRKETHRERMKSAHMMDDLHWI